MAGTASVNTGGADLILTRLETDGALPRPIDLGRIVLAGSRLRQREAGSGRDDYDYDFAIAQFGGDAIFIDGLDGY